MISGHKGDDVKPLQAHTPQGVDEFLAPTPQPLGSLSTLQKYRKVGKSV